MDVSTILVRNNFLAVIGGIQNKFAASGLPLSSLAAWSGKPIEAVDSERFMQVFGAPK